MPVKTHRTVAASAAAAFAAVGLSAAVLPAAMPAPAAAAQQQKDAAADAAAGVPRIPIESYTLPNGLRVNLVPDKSAPVVAVNVTYDVGSRNERPGRTGFAHLFEHMMFQGSENVGKGEHFQLVSTNGGGLNGTTSQDRTNYFETLPANQLELGLFLEADRMRSLDVSQENLDNQRLVVQEERRQRYDNAPYGQVQEAVLGLAYTNFAYKHSTIGSMADLNAATLQDVRDFFATYYAPSNAVLTVAGDFDDKEARRLIEKHFGPLQKKPAPPAVEEAEPSRFSRERRKTLTDALARQPLWEAVYVTVPGDDPDYWALNLLGTILGNGRTSPLYQATVEKNLALNVGAGQAESRGPGLFRLSALVAPGAKAEDVEAAVDGVVERIQKQGVSDEDMERARRAERAAFVQGYRAVRAKSNAIGEYSVYFNDPNRINTYLEKAVAVTKEDVQRAAQKYLTKNNRSVVIVQPGGGPPAAQAPAAAAATAAPAAPAAAGKGAGK